MVTVDSICIQAYLVFKAAGKKRGGKEKSQLSPHVLKTQSHHEANSSGHVNRQKVVSVKESQTH